MDIRKNICIAKNVKYTTQFQLEDLFLTRSESEFLAKKSDYCDLVQFREWLKDTEKLVREARKLQEKKGALERRTYVALSKQDSQNIGLEPKQQLSKIQKQIEVYENDLNFILEDEYEKMKMNKRINQGFNLEMNDNTNSSHALQDVTMQIASFMNKAVKSKFEVNVDEKHTGFMIYKAVGESNCGLVC